MGAETPRLSRKETQARTRQALIDAAARAFRRDGFHRASVEAIAAEAGFTRGAFYANFDGKESLFLEMMDQEMRSRFELFTSDLSPRGFATTYLRKVDEDPEWTLALLEFTIHAARTPTLRDQLIERNQRLLASVVEAGRAYYPALTAAQAAAAARFIFAIQSGAGLERALDPSSIRVEDLEGPLAAATS